MLLGCKPRRWSYAKSPEKSINRFGYWPHRLQDAIDNKGNDFLHSPSIIKCVSPESYNVFPNFFSECIFMALCQFFSNKEAIKRPSSYYESGPEVFMTFIKSDFF